MKNCQIKQKVLDVNNYTDWENTKFEILNNTLIYPTKEVDFNNLAIVYSLEFNTRRSLSRSISINRLQLTSQALNDNSFNPVGTKFGENLFPYKKVEYITTINLKILLVFINKALRIFI